MSERPGAFTPGSRSDDERELRKVLELRLHLIDLLEREFPGIGRDQVEATFFGVVMQWHQGSDTSKNAGDVGYFHMLTRRRLSHLASSERSRHDREAAWVQEHLLDLPGPEVPVEELTAITAMIEALGTELQDKIAALLKPEERVVFRLQLEGHRRTEVFAEALDIPKSTPIEKARKEVRKVKDRVRKQLRRNPAIRRLAVPLLAAWREACESGLRP